MPKKYSVTLGNADDQVTRDLEAAAKSTFGYNAIFVLPLINKALSQDEVKRELAAVEALGKSILGRAVLCKLEVETEAGFEGEADINELEFKLLHPIIEAAMKLIAKNHIATENFVLAIYDQKTGKSLFKALQPSAYKKFDPAKYRTELDQRNVIQQEENAARLFGELLTLCNQIFVQNGVILFQPEMASEGRYGFAANPEFVGKLEGTKTEMRKQFQAKLTKFLLQAQKVYGPGKLTLKFQDGSIEEHPFLLPEPKVAKEVRDPVVATIVDTAGVGADVPKLKEEATPEARAHFFELLTKAGFVLNEGGNEVIGIKPPVVEALVVPAVTKEGASLRFPPRVTSTWFDIVEGYHRLSPAEKEAFLTAFAPISPMR